MIGLTGVVLAVSALVPASAGTSVTRPPVALTAVPAHVSLAGSATEAVRVTNSGNRPVVVDVRPAGFALDLRGRPRIVARAGARGAVPWLRFRPQRLALAAGATGMVMVTSRIPRHVEPGDHDALLLLTTRPLVHASLAMRMRIGVVVVVRTPGAIVRRLSLQALHVRRRGRSRLLEIGIANRGNITEALESRRIDVTLISRGRTPAKLRPHAVELRPRTRGLVQVAYPGAVRGWTTVRVRILSAGVVARRTYRVRL